MAETLPTVVTSAGLVPLAPLDIRAKLIANILATNPGYTADLPGSLVEDISSTDVAAVYLAETARVDSVNSVTPYGCNSFILAQLGEMFGVPVGEASNTSVFVQFTGTPGFPIPPGFLVGDGVFQYIITDGGVVGSDQGDGTGLSPLLFAVATQTGSWAVPSGTVQAVLTSLPAGVALTVNNPAAGIPSQAAETESEYRADVIDAGLAATSGTPTMLRTGLRRIDGVQDRLISIIQLPLNAGWEIIVGGGDPYQVAGAIVDSGVDLAAVAGSTISVTSVTKANPGVYTTNLNHGLVDGQTGVIVSGSTPGTYNHTGTVHVIDEKTFSFPGFDTTGFATYVSGGAVSPNPRNVTVSLNYFPDTYTLTYVNPPQQAVLITLTWNTSALNFVSAAAVSQTGQPAIAAYINSITVGQPINVFQMEDAFKASIAGILDPSLVTRMVWVVTINGVVTTPVSGTGIYQGDPESYFFTSSSQITILQG